MNRKDLERIVDNPNMIPGVFNYCDRWCERCHLTSKCSTYAMEKEEFGDDERDLENKAYWEKISGMLKLTMEMILEDAEKLGIDLDSIDSDDIMANEEDLRERVDHHPLALVSKNYMQDASVWFNEAEEVLTQKEDELIKSQELGIKNNEDAELNDIIEIISWYKFQIHVKIKRGLHGKMDKVLPEDDEYPKDSDGSVKVALIGIDRSIAAWGRLLFFFSEKEDEILKILVALEQLRRNTEQEFPNSRLFIRVGFDD